MENESPNAKPKRQHTITQVSKRELTWLGHILVGDSARDAGRKCGMSARNAKHTAEWIRPNREDSKKPLLWDVWRARLDRNIRILDADVGNIIRELAIIGFSSIDKFIDFPTRSDAQADDKRDRDLRKSLLDSGKGSRDLNGQPIQDDENDSESWKKYRPGSTIKLKCLEDIPTELMPAIAEINETKDGIRIKLHSKLDALEKLCRIQKLFTQEREDESSIDREITIVVNGSKSKLLAPAVVSVNTPTSS